ncbi:ATP-binding cassette domain-containing protein [Modicisalibacter radicis]|uniref:ATP-binding cassette domain-containing protein n=1 Tax=Halomonas sp. EAR18 TaxID=2518972 RepID=UPI00109C5356|nr:ATP-binding cassette domain-containing protein [Halomonas sp. EAR18]
MAVESAPLLRLDGVDLGHGRQIVLANLTLDLHAGERVALLGQSGAGKSTLLAALRRRLAGDVAWCPQSHGLVPQLAVYHNIYMGRLERHSALANLWNLIRPERRAWAEIAALCEELGLDGLLRRPVAQLSGGQRQRVAIARALYQQRRLFLGDEPVASVDPHQALRLLALIDERHATSVVALHQRELALSHFDRVWGLRNGRLELDAPTRELDLADLDRLYPAADAPHPTTDVQRRAEAGDA